jgi:cyclophilin family peptidyl-prolyl cis-trans isomerase
VSSFSPDSIPDVSEVREGLVHRLERHRVPILAGIAVAVLGSLGLLAWSSVGRERIENLRTELHSVTDDFRGNRTLYSGVDAPPNRDLAEDQAKRLEEIRGRAAGTEVEPLVLLHLALRYQVMAEDAKVLALLDEIRAKHPGSSVLRIPSYDSDRAPLVERLASISKRRQAFAAEHRPVEPKPDTSAVALVETDLGKMKVVLYPDLAPRHAEAFLRVAKQGGFNGTRLYSARRGDWIELGGGDRGRNDEARDDRDDDPSVAMPPEDGARLKVKHRRRTVTSVPMLSGDQADRFAVVLSETRPDFDAVRTPFGELLDDESAATADRLGSALTYGEDAAFVNRRERSEFPNTPSRPVILRRVSVWKSGVLDAGHAWDTSRVDTDQPEPAPEENKPGESGAK